MYRTLINGKDSYLVIQNACDSLVFPTSQKNLNFLGNIAIQGRIKHNTIGNAQLFLQSLST